jgi:hypothetical protein
LEERRSARRNFDDLLTQLGKKGVMRHWPMVRETAQGNQGEDGLGGTVFVLRGASLSEMADSVRL